MNEIAIPSAGHHDKDPGAIGNGYREADITKLIRDSILKRFNQLGIEFNKDEDWETNTQYQNRIRYISGKVILDIHLNAGPASANGSEVIISKNASSMSKDFANEILLVTCKTLNTRNRGLLTEDKTPRQRLGILNMSGLAALVEVCFISNKAEMETLMSPGVIDALGCEYADIMIKYDKLYNK